MEDEEKFHHRFEIGFLVAEPTRKRREMLSQFALIKSYLDERSARSPYVRWKCSRSGHMCESRSAKKSEKREKNEGNWDYQFSISHAILEKSLVVFFFRVPFLYAYGSSHYYLRVFVSSPSFYSTTATTTTKLFHAEALMRLLTINSWLYSSLFLASLRCCLQKCRSRKKRTVDDNTTKIDSS